MKKLLLISFNILLIIWIYGCSSRKPEVEVTKDNFSKFDSSEFVKAYIVCVPFKSDPNRRSFAHYYYEFPINDLKKAEVIKMCIRDANYTDYDIERTTKKRNSKNGNSGLFVFETKKLRYTIRIFWDNESAYGYWWESPELLSIFRGWGLFEDLAKADPNWPPTKWIGTPSGERVPFTTEPNSSRFRKVPYSRGRDINDNSLKKETETK
jgi:hypothetical protein